MLPAGTKLRAHLELCYGYRLREWGSLQALLARLGAQLRGWAGLQEAVELSIELSGLPSDRDGDGDMEAGLDRLLPALIDALAPVAASIHTLELSFSRHQLGAAMSASLVCTLPSLCELHVSWCHLHDSMAAPLAQMRQLRLLCYKAPQCKNEADWGQLAAALAALLADGGQAGVGGGRVDRLRLAWEEELVRPYMAQVKRLQAVVEAVSAAGLATLFTHNLDQLRSTGHFL